MIKSFIVGDLIYLGTYRLSHPGATNYRTNKKKKGTQESLATRHTILRVNDVAVRLMAIEKIKAPLSGLRQATTYSGTTMDLWGP